MENENPNQGGAQLQEQVSDQSASETVQENVNTETKSDNIPSYEWHRRVLGENKSTSHNCQMLSQDLKLTSRKRWKPKANIRI